MTTVRDAGPYGTAQRRFDRAADLLGLEPMLRDLLREPARETRFAIPMRGDGHAAPGRVFRGYRVVHNDARGPAQGGFRLHPTGTLDPLRALAMAATWTCAVAGVPAGGASGGVGVDPHGLSDREQEALCRGWARKMADALGPWADVPEPDLGTSPRHMLWMLDELEGIRRAHQPGSVSGKPQEAGGGIGRKEAAGYGAMIVLREALRSLGHPPDKVEVSVQGFGAAGRAAMDMLERLGATVVAVATWDPRVRGARTFAREGGVRLHELREIADPSGTIDPDAARARGYDVQPGDAWLTTGCEVLVAAALEGQIGETEAARLPARLKALVEIASNPVLPEAESTLQSRNVLVLPDLLAGAGGALGSHFERVQSQAGTWWEADETLARLDARLTAAWDEVETLSRKKRLGLRDAAMALAVDRVAAACRGRGWA